MQAYQQLFAELIEEGWNPQLQDEESALPSRLMPELPAQWRRVKGLSPEEHYFDGGYASLDNLVHGRAQAIAIYRPMCLNTSWQAQTEQGFSSANFFIDWERNQVLCPNGKTSLTWSESQPKMDAPSIAIPQARALDPVYRQ